jgi:hypothetical protein
MSLVIRYCSGFTKKMATSGIEGKGEAGDVENGENGMFSNSYYERTGWNLNNIAASEGSVLKYLQVCT